MPEKLLRPLCLGTKFRIRDLSKIADTLNVSVTALCFRVLELNFYNGIIIQSNGIKVTNFFKNTQLPTKIWPVSLIDRESCAFYIRNGEVGDRRGFSVPGDLWIARADASYYELFEDSLVVAPGKLISLISWDSERYLLKLADD